MKSIIYFLVFISMVSVASALTIENGTQFNPSHQNTTFNITENIDIDTVTVNSTCMVITYEDGQILPFCYNMTSVGFFNVDLNYEFDSLELADGSTILFVDQNNGNCDDSYTREQALDPTTPWCSPMGFMTGWRLVPKIQGGDTVYILNGSYNDKGNENFLYLNSSTNPTQNINIYGYPYHNATLTNFMEEYNGSNSEWTNISYNGMNIWKTTNTDLSTNYPIAYRNSTYKFLTVRCANYTPCDYTMYLNRSDRNLDMIYGNDTSNEIYLRLKDLDENPNEMELYIAEEDQNIIIVNYNGAGTITIENITFKYHRRALETENSSNIVFNNNVIYGGHYGIRLRDTYNQAENLTVTKNILYGMWNFGETWYEDYIKEAYEETTAIGFNNAPQKNIFINNNTIYDWAGGITPYSTDRAEGCNTEIAYNVFYNGTGSQLEPENTGCNLSIHHNNISNSWYGLSIGAGECTLQSPCNVTYNIIHLADYIIENETVKYSTYAFKPYTVSGWNVSNWLIEFNTFIAKNNAIYDVYTSGREHDMKNCTLRNNIMYAYNQSSTGAVISGSGEYNDGNHYDYNLYYFEGEGVFASRWNNETNTVKYATMADARDSVNNTGNWDLNSKQADPLFLSGTFQPQWNSPACSAASDGTDIGALACQTAPSPLAQNSPVAHIIITRILGVMVALSIILFLLIPIMNPDNFDLKKWLMFFVLSIIVIFLMTILLEIIFTV